MVLASGMVLFEAIYLACECYGGVMNDPDSLAHSDDVPVSDRLGTATRCHHRVHRDEACCRDPEPHRKACLVIRQTLDSDSEGGATFTKSSRPSSRPGACASRNAATTSRCLSQATARNSVPRADQENWFPHISPNGLSIVFLTYAKGVGDHPENKDVALRVMDLKTRKVDVLAKLFGGQGTINVSSWSPDSQYLAFVSYQVVPQ